jgi:hypothetical protein
MNFKSLLAIPLLLMFAVFLGCAAQERSITEPPPEPPAFLEGVADAKWGMQVKEVKEAVETFQDDTGKPPFALYASRKHFDLPAIVSYFFTPKSQKLYRTDVTFNNPGVYGAVRGKLVQMFKDPTYTPPDTELWLWKDSSMLILQKNPNSVEVSFSSGPLLKLNYEERGAPVKAVPRESFWDNFPRF